jgi:hypothetical protein
MNIQYQEAKEEEEDRISYILGKSDYSEKSKSTR